MLSTLLMECVGSIGVCVCVRASVLMRVKAVEQIAALRLAKFGIRSLYAILLIPKYSSYTTMIILIAFAVRTCVCVARDRARSIILINSRGKKRGDSLERERAHRLQHSQQPISEIIMNIVRCGINHLDEIYWISAPLFASDLGAVSSALEAETVARHNLDEF